MNTKFLSSVIVATMLTAGGSVLGQQADTPQDQTAPAVPAPHMMGPGMMGQGTTGPGMMGSGAMGMNGMGPGMMGQNGMNPGMMMGSGMMGPGMMMGQNMMGSGMMAPGMMMGSGVMGRPAPSLDLSADDVKANFERWLAWNGNPNLKLGKVKEKDKNTITAEIVTKDNSLVQRYEIDRASGFMHPAG